MRGHDITHRRGIFMYRSGKVLKRRERNYRLQFGNGHFRKVKQQCTKKLKQKGAWYGKARRLEYLERKERDGQGVVWSEERESRGKEGFVNQDKNFCFYSECDAKPQDRLDQQEPVS